MKTLIKLSDRSLMQVIRLSKKRQTQIKLQKFEKANWEFEKLKIKGNNKKNGDNQQQQNSQQKFWLN